MKTTKKEEKINAEFERFLPGIVILPFRSGNETGVFHSVYSIQPENYNLMNSEYYYKGELKFVHFSSLFAIQSILKSKTIRLYNLYKLEDPREYSFAGDLITFNQENKEDAKTNMFLFAMCNKNILTGPPEYEFNMWRIYGQNGGGVCIQFDFSLNPQTNWRDYFLSEVHYGASSKTNLESIKNLLQKYENEKPKTEIDLGQIVAFHKSNLYRLESEVRLLYDNRERKILKASIYRDSDGNQVAPRIELDLTESVSNNKEIKYLELPIYHEKFQPVFTPNKIPIPKIEKIILGHAYKDNFADVKQKLEILAENCLGYTIEIQLSRLTKLYYEK
jgi:hypothetical protein